MLERNLERGGVTLTKEQLRRLLEAERVPEIYYSLEGGLPYDRWCLAQTRKGWEVYYSERGGKDDLELFESESDACDCLHRHLQKYRDK